MDGAVGFSSSISSRYVQNVCFSIDFGDPSKVACGHGYVQDVNESVIVQVSSLISVVTPKEQAKRLNYLTDVQDVSNPPHRLCHQSIDRARLITLLYFSPSRIWQKRRHIGSNVRSAANSAYCASEIKGMLGSKYVCRNCGCEWFWQWYHRSIEDLRQIDQEILGNTQTRPEFLHHDRSLFS